MTHLARSRATLRVTGEGLDQAEISRLLGSPSDSSSSFVSGIWRLVASDREPEDLDGQVQELLTRLSQDVAVWRALATRYRIDLLCGWFMNGRNEGVTLAPSTLTALGERSIELGVDIYAPDERSNPTFQRTALPPLN